MDIEIPADAKTVAPELEKRCGFTLRSLLPQISTSAADDFMMRCVGDFYEIDPYLIDKRREKVEERVFRDYLVFKGQRKLECSFRDPGRMFVVTTSVQETEIR